MILWCLWGNVIDLCLGAQNPREPRKDLTLEEADNWLVTAKSGRFQQLQQPAKWMSITADIKMQFSEPNADIRKAGGRGLRQTLQPCLESFLRLLGKAIFNTHSKYQPDW